MILLKFLLWAVFFLLICLVTGKASRQEGNFVLKGINTLAAVALIVCLCGLVWNLAIVCWHIMVS